MPTRAGLRPSTPPKHVLAFGCAHAGGLVVALHRSGHTPHHLTSAEREALWSAADREFAGVVERNATCARDEDCEIIEFPHRCLWSCDTAIARSGRGTYNGVQARLRGGPCNEWKSGGCLETTPKAVPSCASLTARCQGGRCTAVY